MAANSWEAVLNRVQQAGHSSEELRLSVAAFHQAVDEVRSKISGDLLSRFDSSLAAKLTAIDKNTSQYITDDYRDVLFATRLFGLCDNVVKVPFRNLPEKKEIWQQQVDQLNKFLEPYRNAPPGCDPNVWKLALKHGISEVENVQNDLFMPCWGAPLSKTGMAGLTTIFAEARGKALALSDELSGSDLPPDRHREAAQIGVDTRKAVLSLLLSRGTSTIADINEADTQAIDRWHRERSAIIQATADRLASVESKEFAAFTSLVARQGEKRRIEDSPTEIDRKLNEVQRQRSISMRQEIDKSVNRVFYYVMLASSAILVLAVTFIFRQRR